MVEKELLSDPSRPKYKGVPRPVDALDFEGKAAMYVPEKARYDYLLNLPGEADVCKAVNDAMTAIENGFTLPAPAGSTLQQNGQALAYATSPDSVAAANGLSTPSFPAFWKSTGILRPLYSSIPRKLRI